jgi:hypothetical protein
MIWVLVFFALFAFFAGLPLAACMLSSRISRQEERNPLYREGGGR